MGLNTAVQPIYFPDPEQQTVLRMGLQNLSLDNWLHLDEDFVAFHQHKLELKALSDDSVSRETKGAEEVIEEFNNFLLKHLLEHHAKQFLLHNERLQHKPSQLEFDAPATTLWQSSLWVQDDICLLQPQGSTYVLSAASLCSPSNWRLEDKIGHTVEWIHKPVPNYQYALSERVDTLLARLKPEQPVMRFNWSVQNSNELNWHENSERNLDHSQGSCEFYWRVERQALLKLPATGAIAFTIRIFLHSFDAMEQATEDDNNHRLSFKQTLAQIIERLPEETRHYKGLNENLLERLQRK
ncbi:MAG: DUF3445 domain-containing protein [Pseudomonadales bacterium]|nr:DUF3445 domain-containing protein [Pseudomonadales bacterium]